MGDKTQLYKGMTPELNPLGYGTRKQAPKGGVCGVEAGRGTSAR